MLWPSAQGADVGEVGKGAERTGPGRARDQLAVDGIPTVCHARLGGDEIDPGAIGKPQALGDLAAPVVIVADDGMLGACRPRAP